MDLGKMWACDQPIDGGQVAALVDVTFAELAPARAAVLGAGWDCTVFTINDRWVFRFPKRAEVGPLLVIEQALTRTLAADLPVPIPEVRWLAPPGPGFPSAWAGHPLLPGVPAAAVALDPAARRRVGARAGELVAALHATAVPRALALGVPVRRAFAEDLPRFHEVARHLFALLTRVRAFSPERAAHMAERLAAPPPAPSRLPAVVLHGELTANNLLLDPDTHEPSGVIDWTDARIGDPAGDFAGLYQCGGEELLAAALAAYPAADEALAARARFIGRCGALFALIHALDQPAPGRLEAAWAIIDRM